MSSSKDRYVCEATPIIFDRMESMGLKFAKRHKSLEHPFSNEAYIPDLDVSKYCNPHEHQFYQQTVNITRWMIEIG